MDTKRKALFSSNETERANELNDFYLHFETGTFTECCAILENVHFNMDEERIVIDPQSVSKVFESINTKKATGPDNMSAFLLKTFADELSPVWHRLYQLSVDTHSVPELWRKSVIIPVPKTPCPQLNNDYWPVALTSNVMKCLERLLLNLLQTEVEPSLIIFQFAYTKKRSTSDAISTLMHLVLKHLENPAAYAWLLFIDFSSSFNTIQPHLLLTKLVELDVNPFLIRWYHSFLTNQSQQVKFNSVLSNTTVSSTGIPQGCVSSPFLFTLCTKARANQYVVKFSDDTAILSLLTDNPGSHKAAVGTFVDWWDAHKLPINTTKTVEIWTPNQLVIGVL